MFTADATTPAASESASYASDYGAETVAGPEPMPAASVVRFALAGNATFTVVSKATGTRFTYRIRAPKVDRDGAPVSKEAAEVLFVSVLTGPQNTSDYTYFGTVFRKDGNKFRHSNKSRVAADATSVKAFAWMFEHVLKSASGADKCVVYHAGTCGRCGRLLTTPESVRLGLGPECASKC